MTTKFSIVIPCYNEEKTLQNCVERVLALQSADLLLEVIIVDDCSSDRSLSIARSLAEDHSEVIVLQHKTNQGKGGALRTGFRKATGDFVAVQDADLEYNPLELKNLLEPLWNQRADIVLGSRFAGGGPHRVVYFWHCMGNRFLTFLSNMFTDLNLTDMETCYKVFRREIIQGIEIQENRFGFEPEIVAKIAHRGLRIYEMGISYCGRTYAEGKKIGATDGFRALYCIFRYNAHKLPLPMQFVIYALIGGVSAAVNLLVFLACLSGGLGFTASTISAFVLAAALNYFLCILLLFRHKARWNSFMEVLFYTLVVAASGAMTKLFWAMGNAPWLAKALASVAGLLFNFFGRRVVVFPEAVPHEISNAEEQTVTGTTMGQAQLDGETSRYP